PQVERRRRERMNRSLENLKALLLQEPQQQVRRRVEKAEILEHTVLFLQKTAIGDTKTAAGGGQQHSFQDGFSTCLQRAAHFLGPQGKGLRLAATLDATFAARFPLSDSGGVKAAAKVHSSSSLPHTNFSQLSPQTMKQKSKLRLNVHAFIPQHSQRPNQLEIRVERRASKQSPTRSPPVSQSLWRPWP
uniref:Hairy and enhancer of split related-7 n=1 Tax=Myripristis murdjan TaxID=586833 RepID=A0A667WU38_9TELE